MKFIFFLLILFLFGLVFGYLKLEPGRASVEMGDFDLKVPEKE